MSFSLINKYEVSTYYKLQFEELRIWQWTRETNNERMLIGEWVGDHVGEGGDGTCKCPEEGKPSECPSNREKGSVTTLREEGMNWVTIQKQLPWSPESHGEGWNFIPCAMPLRGCKQRQCDPSGCFVYHYIFSRQESEHSSLPDC